MAERDNESKHNKTPSLTPRFLDLASLHPGTSHVRLAYHYYRSGVLADDTSSSLVLPVAVLFCGGFRSSMSGQKARFLQEACCQRQEGVVFCRFDYRVHGESEPCYNSDSTWRTEASLGNWISDALCVLDHVLAPDRHGSVVLVGSSMGAWIALHVALARPHRVAGIVGVAAAPDFTEHLLRTFTPEQHRQLEQEGVVYVPSQYDRDQPYPITRQLLHEARQWLVWLDETSSLPIHCPVRLMHGLDDADIPWEISLRLAQSLPTTDVQLTLVKDGDHRLSRPSDLRLLAQLLNDVLDITTASSIGES